MAGQFFEDGAADQVLFLDSQQSKLGNPGGLNRDIIFRRKDRIFIHGAEGSQLSFERA